MGGPSGSRNGAAAAAATTHGIIGVGTTTLGFGAAPSFGAPSLAGASGFPPSGRATPLVAGGAGSLPPFAKNFSPPRGRSFLEMHGEKLRGELELELLEPELEEFAKTDLHTASIRLATELCKISVEDIQWDGVLEDSQDWDEDGVMDGDGVMSGGGGPPGAFGLVGGGAVPKVASPSAARGDMPASDQQMLGDYQTARRQAREELGFRFEQLRAAMLRNCFQTAPSWRLNFAGARKKVGFSFRGFGDFGSRARNLKFFFGNLDCPGVLWFSGVCTCICVMISDRDRLASRRKTDVVFVSPSFDPSCTTCKHTGFWSSTLLTAMISALPDLVPMGRVGRDRCGGASVTLHGDVKGMAKLVRQEKNRQKFRRSYARISRTYRSRRIKQNLLLLTGEDRREFHVRKEFRFVVERVDFWSLRARHSGKPILFVSGRQHRR